MDGLSLLVRAFLIVALPYWPPSPAWDLQPNDYPDRVAVINDLGRPLRNLDEALHEWNRCGSRLRLVKDRSATPFSPGTITITPSHDGGAYGGWGGDHGTVFLGDRWTRARSVIAHEVGHALGFWHARANDTIMGDSSHVTTKDCQGLRNFYGRR